MIFFKWGAISGKSHIFANIFTEFEKNRVTLGQTEGREMGKTHHYTVISPDEMNDYLQTVTVALLTSTIKPLPSRNVLLTL
ncbi:MAG: type II toxin-antitoxin system PemK/MazF family toxin [Tannerella sp.]|nr:type II toxin-antitoxin system PemK/MazF family toxin [Tannerella sp.]